MVFVFIYLVRRRTHIMATRTLSPEKSAKLARALAQCFDAHLNLERVRTEVYTPEPKRQPSRKTADQHAESELATA